MLATKYDVDGKIVAYVEYDIVDHRGNYCEVGQYCFIRELWIHKSIRELNTWNTLRELVMNEHMKFPLVKYLYFLRRKHDNRMSTYDITRFYRRSK